jgi:signal transduction histidine kinase
LRACVPPWVEHQHTPALASFQDMIRFNEAIDEAWPNPAAYAEQVARSRDIFLAILGHDLRAPLQAVNMSTEVLLQGHAGQPGLEPGGQYQTVPGTWARWSTICWVCPQSTGQQPAYRT